MILIDSSLWIEYFHGGHPQVQALLTERRAAIHDLIIGELAIGDLRDRQETLGWLQRIKRATHVSEEEALGLIESEDLWGRGLGYIDVHLLAATLVTPGCRLWSRDKRLAAEAERLGASFAPQG